MSVNILEPMIGVTMTEVEGNVGGSLLSFRAPDGRVFQFAHQQECCEGVAIEDICGDIRDLVGSPIVEAEEVSNADAPVREFCESHTWTFYRFATAKGAVTVRWLGESNGYYGEGVSFEIIQTEAS